MNQQETFDTILSALRDDREIMMSFIVEKMLAANLPDDDDAVAKSMDDLKIEIVQEMIRLGVERTHYPPLLVGAVIGTYFRLADHVNEGLGILYG